MQNAHRTQTVCASASNAAVAGKVVGRDVNICLSLMFSAATVRTVWWRMTPRGNDAGTAAAALNICRVVKWDGNAICKGWKSEWGNVVTGVPLQPLQCVCVCLMMTMVSAFSLFFNTSSFSSFSHAQAKKCWQKANHILTSHDIRGQDRTTTTTTASSTVWSPSSSSSPSPPPQLLPPLHKT